MEPNCFEDKGYFREIRQCHSSYKNLSCTIREHSPQYGLTVSNCTNSQRSLFKFQDEIYWAFCFQSRSHHQWGIFSAKKLSASQLYEWIVADGLWEAKIPNQITQAVYSRPGKRHIQTARLPHHISSYQPFLKTGIDDIYLYGSKC